ADGRKQGVAVALREESAALTRLLEDRDRVVVLVGTRRQRSQQREYGEQRRCADCSFHRGSSSANAKGSRFRTKCAAGNQESGQNRTPSIPHVPSTYAMRSRQMLRCSSPTATSATPRS